MLQARAEEERRRIEHQREQEVAVKDEAERRLKLCVNGVNAQNSEGYTPFAVACKVIIDLDVVRVDDNVVHFCCALSFLDDFF